MSLEIKYHEVMRNTPLFMDLDQKDFLCITKGIHPHKLKAGETLFTQKQAAKEFFLLVEGQIKISLLSAEGTEKVVDIINAGNTFAEVIIFNGMSGYPVNSKALTDALVLRINAARYKDVLKNSPEACFKIMGRLSSRLHWLMNEMERLSLHNASYRLISYLLENIAEDVYEKTEVKLTAPKHVIASRISITPETFSRTLKRLSNEGLIEVHDEHIVLSNPNKLRQMLAI